MISKRPYSVSFKVSWKSCSVSQGKPRIISVVIEIGLFRDLILSIKV